MLLIHPGLFLIMRRFPEEKNTLRRLYLTNSAFQTICYDYKKCAYALDYWKHSEDDLALERYCEYEELQKSLEQEIEDFLKCAGRGNQEPGTG